MMGTSSNLCLLYMLTVSTLRSERASEFVSPERAEAGRARGSSPETIAASLEPEQNRLIVQSTTKVGVLPVDVGLLGREEVKVVCAEKERVSHAWPRLVVMRKQLTLFGRLVPLPHTTTESASPVARRVASAVGVVARSGPMVPIALGAVLGRPRLLEPVVLVRGVVDDEVENAAGGFDRSARRFERAPKVVFSDVSLSIRNAQRRLNHLYKYPEAKSVNLHLQSALVAAFDEPLDIGDGSVGLVNVLVVRDIITHILLRRLEEGRNPNAGDSGAVARREISETHLGSTCSGRATHPFK